MITVHKNTVYLSRGREIIPAAPQNQARLTGLWGKPDLSGARAATMTAQILKAHMTGDGSREPDDFAMPGTDLHLNFDALASHDITFVNIVQTARASGLESFPVPYVLTNCHNSLCAVGGTINEDDHLFGLSAAKRYGGIYVPPHIGVIHAYVRETMASPLKMILGSDSHTRYGSLGTLGVGEGGGELVKQLLRQSYDIAYPRVIAVYLTGAPRPGIGPQDVALGIIKAVFKDGFAKNAVLEFVGDGISFLRPDYRAGIDIMTTETACWSSVWETDEMTRRYLKAHGRETEYQKLEPGELACYDGLIHVDLSQIKPMIALPFHPSNVFEIDTFLENPGDIFRQVEKESEDLIENSGVRLNLTDHVSGKQVRVDQAIVAGCAGGTLDNLEAVRAILGTRDFDAGNSVPKGNEGFSFSVYPGSQPVFLELIETGALADLVSQGVIARSAFCGPCFGAGDVPANNGLSIRHTTRNFPNREGSRPNDGQIASVCLMDSRSIAATALNNGYLASAESLGISESTRPSHFRSAPYLLKVYNGTGKPDKSAELRFGPNIVDWPAMDNLGENILLRVVSYINDPVTTTDELIPSGETSSFRSNPVGLAEFTLSRKDPGYVARAKAVRAASEALAAGLALDAEAAQDALEVIISLGDVKRWNKQGGLRLGSAIFARKPGDGSAREQAASCQRVLGGLANFANEYATKRYRSNLINWGILPFIIEEPPFARGDYVFIPGIGRAVREGIPELTAYVIRIEEDEIKGSPSAFTLKIPELNPVEKQIILEGSLINYNRRLLKDRG